VSVRFLIGGVQKGGTTALDDYLRDHPTLRMASVKEAHFFDDETVDWAAPDYRPYHALFGAEDGRVWGEATPIYLYWPNCLERIRRYDPAMKLIFLFRDPVERAWSHWKMEHGRGWETEPFSACIREGRSRAAGDPVTPGFHRIHSYVERGFYGAQLARALALFPREQMLLLRSEDLRENPDGVLEQVCAFVGVAGFGAPVRPREANVGRASGAIDGGDAVYLRGLYAEDLAEFARASGLDVSGWLRSPEGAATGAGSSTAARS
jgi:hypothetical protein